MENITGTPQSWTTWNGRTKMIDEIDQQHLSNIYWFHLILWNKKHHWVFEELGKRFNGQILPYRPHIWFTAEIEELDRMGLLKWSDKKENDPVETAEIFWNGSIIGEVIRPI